MAVVVTVEFPFANFLNIGFCGRSSDVVITDLGVEVDRVEACFWRTTYRLRAEVDVCPPVLPLWKRVLIQLAENIDFHAHIQ